MKRKKARKSSLYKQAYCDQNTIIAKAMQTRIRAKLGFFPERGCELCQLYADCKRQGIWIDPPCTLTNEEVEEVNAELATMARFA